MKYTDYENAMKLIPLSPMKFLHPLVIENLWKLYGLWNALGIGSYEIDKQHYGMKQATVWNNKHNMPITV